MSNVSAIRESKPVIIILDRPRTVRFDLNAYAELEVKYGSVAEAMQQLQGGSIRSIRSLLWAGLIHECLDDNENYTITEKQVGAMLQIDDLERVTEAITTAMMDAMPEEAIEASSNEGNI